MTDKEKFLRAAVACVVLVLFNLFAFGVMVRRCDILKARIAELENAPADTIQVTRIDTIEVQPKPIYKYIRETEVVEVADTLLVHDTTERLVFLPREVAVYKDSTYRAVVSGVQPSLDSLQIYRPTITRTITKTIKKPTRWGLGVQAGCGWNGKEIKPYIGAGIQYNILTW